MAASTPKTMSSRLMTMKFMQRSAGKAAGSEPSTPNGPPSKRMRLSNGASAPGTPVTPYSPHDHEMLQTALAAEEKKREEALARAYEHTGETKWVLSYKDPHAGKRPPVMQVRQAGFAVIDADEDSDEEEEDKPIRMKFGGGLKKKKVVRGDSAGQAQLVFTDELQDQPHLVKAEGSESESESQSSSGDLESDDPTAELIKETRREVAAKERNARKAHNALTVTPARRVAAPIDEDMDLSGLTSLSGGNRPNAGRDMSNVECFSCGKKGHMRDNCPKPRGTAGRGRGRGGERSRGPARY
ncbi:hypothetical protein N0V90_008792 [Kalmusia sp. IMI 367209]|nr:hypothetical protein N0V90_008792 [Kalmusia sp. IMI 367209]